MSDAMHHNEPSRPTKKCAAYRRSLPSLRAFRHFASSLLSHLFWARYVTLRRAVEFSFLSLPQSIGARTTNVCLSRRGTTESDSMLMLVTAVVFILQHAVQNSQEDKSDFPASGH